MELKQQRIGVLMGGVSAERSVSLETGTACLEALQRKGYNAVKIDVDKEIAATLADRPIDHAYIALHGPYGEDGRIQGLLDLLGIPYSGSGVLSSAVTMDKITTKRMAVYAGIPTPCFQVIRKDRWSKAGRPAVHTHDTRDASWNEVEVNDPALPHLQPPVVVKAPLEGSSYGVTIVREKEAMNAALETAFEYGDLALVEMFIPGSEITIGILNGVPLPAIEIVPPSEYYDFEAKYKSDDTEYLLPPRLDRSILDRARELAVRLYRICQCQGVARVDFRVSPQGMPFLLEINTIPGMTSHSLIPKAAKALSLGFDELVEHILTGQQPLYS